MHIINRTPVGGKIIASVLIGVVSLIGISILSIFRIAEINETVENLSQKLAVEQRYAEQIHGDTLQLQIDINQYIIYQKQSDLDVFTEHVSAFESNLMSASEFSDSDTRKKNIASISQHLSIVKAVFADIVEILQQRNDTVNQTLEIVGPYGTNQIQSILKESRINENSLAGNYSVDILSAFTNMQYNTYKYLQTGNEDWAAMVDDYNKQAMSNLTSLETILEEEELIDAAQKARSAITNYNNSVEGMLVGYRTQNTLEEIDLINLHTNMQDTAKAMSVDVQQDFDAAGLLSKKTVANTKFTIIVASILATFFSLIISLLLASSIVRPLKAVMDISEQVANQDLQSLLDEMRYLSQGDLTRQLDIHTSPLIITSNDEIGKMGTAFNSIIARLKETGSSFADMSTSLRELVGAVRLNAEDIKHASDELATSSNQAGEATNQIAMTIQQVASGITQQTQSVTTTASAVEDLSRAIDGVAKGAQQQAESINDISMLSNNMSQSIQRVTENIKTVTQNSEKAASLSRNGSTQVAETIHGMETIQKTVQQSVNKVQEMGERSKQIGVILETIEDIASQTNLLALNAAIEAARAGEHGKGFSVVADEVRKLAERSGAATKEISVLIKSIQYSVSEAIHAMETTSSQVEDGVNKAGGANTALKDILDSVETVSMQADEVDQAAVLMLSAANDMVNAVDNVSAVVEENTAATQEMTTSSESLRISVESIASVSEENSASVEEVSASTEEITAQVSDVAQASTTLKDMAENLFQMISTFKLEVDNVIDIELNEYNVNEEIQNDLIDTLFDENMIQEQDSEEDQNT
ncbi:MAG: methyl-accepting chemotaxis protein [Anaerolineaceae bacterium]|nr:methyl-accepting chemotaxis protein [Anaerolineaceae bacterium]